MTGTIPGMLRRSKRFFCSSFTTVPFLKLWPQNKKVLYFFKGHWGVSLRQFNQKYSTSDICLRPVKKPFLILEPLWKNMPYWKPVPIPPFEKKGNTRTIPFYKLTILRSVLYTPSTSIALWSSTIERIITRSEIDSWADYTCSWFSGSFFYLWFKKV